jgi:PAS domain S-box-containing protein
MVKKTDLDKNRINKGRLRDVAEKKLGKSPDVTQEFKDKTPEEIVHELQVHQIELEIQNHELRRTQLELEESRDNYQSLYDFSPVGYFTLTHKGIIQEVNLTGATLLGMPRPKLIGRGFGHFVAPESENQWDHHILAVFGQQGKHTCDLNLKCEDGSLLYAGVESIRIETPFRGGGEQAQPYQVRMALMDITERKRLETERFEIHEKFLLAFENANIGVCLVDLQGKILQVNNKMCEIFGYEKPELERMTVNSIAHPDDRNVSPNFISHALEGEYKVLEFEKRYYHKLGHVIFGKVSSSLARDAQGKPLYFVSHIQDVSESKRLEQEKDNLIIELQKALSEVKKLSGFLPICASCKKIRDDTGYWNEIERYISERSGTQFSHSICPDCMRKLYPEEADEILGPLEKDEEK